MYHECTFLSEGSYSLSLLGELFKPIFHFLEDAYYFLGQMVSSLYHSRAEATAGSGSNKRNSRKYKEAFMTDWAICKIVDPFNSLLRVSTSAAGSQFEALTKPFSW